MIAEVIINTTAKKLNRTFDYNIPKELEEQIYVGCIVLVPFGNIKKLEEAFVVGIKEKSEYKLKDIVKIQNTLDEFQIKLAKWMAKKYFCNISECIKLMQTPGTRNKDIEKRIQDKKINAIYLKKDIEEIEFDIQTNKIKSEKQIRTLNFIKDNEGATVPEIEAYADSSRAIINTLIKNGYLEIVEQTIYRNPIKNKQAESTSNLELNEEQKQAYKKIEKTIDENRFEEFLLYGITGSRKNRNIYATYRKSHRLEQNSYFISTRNIFDPSNDRKIY